MLPPFILFDLDDTLFDHTKASRIALTAVHASHARDVDFDAFALEHAQVVEVYHARFLSGEFNLDEARLARMTELFSTFENRDHGSQVRQPKLHRHAGSLTEGFGSVPIG